MINDLSTRNGRSGNRRAHSGTITPCDAEANVMWQGCTASRLSGHDSTSIIHVSRFDTRAGIRCPIDTVGFDKMMSGMVEDGHVESRC